MSDFGSNLRIVSNGTSQTTKVFVGDVEVTGVIEIEIEPITVNGIVEAKITVGLPKIDVTAYGATNE